MLSYFYLEKFLLTLILMIRVWWSKFSIFGMLQLGSYPIVSIAYDPEDGASPTLPLLLRIPLLDVYWELDHAILYLL